MQAPDKKKFEGVYFDELDADQMEFALLIQANEDKIEKEMGIDKATFPEDSIHSARISAHYTELERNQKLCEAAQAAEKCNAERKKIAKRDTQPAWPKPAPKRKSDWEDREDDEKLQKKAYQAESSYTRSDDKWKRDKDGDNEEEDQTWGCWRDEKKSTWSHGRHWGRSWKWKTGTYAWTQGLGAPAHRRLGQTSISPTWMCLIPL